MNMPIVIYARYGDAEEDTYVFSKPTECLVGSAPDCTIRVLESGPTAAISHNHCLIEIDTNYIWLTDLGSKTGTYLNNRRIKSSKEVLEPVKNGDVIRAGKLELVIMVEEHATVEDLDTADTKTNWIN